MMASVINDFYGAFQLTSDLQATNKFGLIDSIDCSFQTPTLTQLQMYKAVLAPRNPGSWSRHRERALMTGLLLKQIGSKLPP